MESSDSAADLVDLEHLHFAASVAVASVVVAVAAEDEELFGRY